MIAFILGMLLWTLAEYLLHRFLGHVPKKPLIYSRFFKEHAKHHYIKDYFAATVDKLLTTLALGPVTFFVVKLFMGTTVALSFTAGFLGMYYGYELLHRRMHVVAPTHRYSSFMRAHHFHHHFENAEVNHGVSTPVWDWVFGTYQKPDLIHVPAQFRLSWLPASGVFSDQYCQKYVVIDKADKNSQ